MSTQKKIVFVCTINKMRSATAHELFGGDARFEVRSAGTDPSAANVLTPDLLAWADAVVVMEKHHRNTIRKRFRELYKTKTIVCLYIPDEYDFMQPELIALLKIRFEEVIAKGLL